MPKIRVRKSLDHMTEHTPLSALMRGTMAVVPSEKADTMSDIKCEIRSRPLAAGLEVIGVVWSDSRASGSYNFLVNKEGPSGSSHVVQRGLFTVEPHQQQVIGTISVDAASGDRYLARLIVYSDGQETICDATLN